MMKLSILDQSPIATNQTPQAALIESMKLAQAGENLGYTRYWIAEHHDLPGLACSAPEVMLSFIGANTSKIRIGSGAVLLPHYKPYKVAEVYHMLSTLYPGRIDLGIGRAPGGTAEATNALSSNYLEQVWRMPVSLNELLHFLKDDFPSDHEFANVTASPLPPISPMPWLLGTSKKSALLAAENGMAYAFGQFMSDNDGATIIKHYKNSFIPNKAGDQAYAIVTVAAVCAETVEKAEEIALSSLIWGLQRDKGEGLQGVPSIAEAAAYMLDENDKQALAKRKDKIIIGDPSNVKKQIFERQAHYQADEIQIVTITHSPNDRLKSYELIANEIIR